MKLKKIKPKIKINSEYTDEFKAMLDKEYEDYCKTGEAIPKEMVDEMIRKLLSKKNNRNEALAKR